MQFDKDQIWDIEIRRPGPKLSAMMTGSMYVFVFIVWADTQLKTVRLNSTDIARHFCRYNKRVYKQRAMDDGRGEGPRQQSRPNLRGKFLISPAEIMS